MIGWETAVAFPVAMGVGPTVCEVDGRLVIKWPEWKPRTIQVSVELFEEMVAQINALRTKAADNAAQCTCDMHFVHYVGCPRAAA